MSTISNSIAIIGWKVSHDPGAAAFLAKCGANDGRVPTYIREILPHHASIHAPSWVALPLTARMGFPLRYSMTQKLAELIPTGDHETLRLLSLDIDPDSTTFGQPSATSQCEITLSRVDLQDLSEKDARAIVAYTRVELADVRALGDIDVGSEEYSAARERALAAVARVTPQRFATFREQYIGGPVCQLCGVPQGWNGVELSACGKCRGANYCGKECQTKDWKIHKVSKVHKDAA